ncbi:MAG TPA: LLM class F420-dependent oxidoreductase [Ktedonobacterales bacterium]
MADTGTSISFGVFVPQGWRQDLTAIADPVEQYEAMTRVAQDAERLGYDSIWVYDHFHTVPTPTRNTTFEAWTITAGLARDTKRVKVGQMATCNGYRNPALLAKMASTVDVMSHGRLILGLGAGWYEHEWRAYGYGFPERRERMARFREACAIVHQMFTEDEPEFHGTYYSIDKPINEPKGAHQPHPRFWIAGGGERVTLRLVAQYGDGCNIGDDPDTVRHKCDVLRQHCAALGRDYDSIVRSTSLEGVHLVESQKEAEREKARAATSPVHEEYVDSGLITTSDRLAERIEALVAAGAQYILLYFPWAVTDASQLERFAREVMPRFASTRGT